MHTDSNIAKHAGILLAFLLVFAVSFTHSQEYPQAITCGIPVITTEYSDYTKLSIDQILDGNDNIYVLLDEHRGIVQVFDLGGEFQYTASFYLTVSIGIGVGRNLFVCASDGLSIAFDIAGNIEVQRSYSSLNCNVESWKLRLPGFFCYRVAFLQISTSLPIEWLHFH